jgi:hypothetical protein
MSHSYTPPSPLGVMPRGIWLGLRYKEILEAMLRFREVDKPIPKEWLDEFLDLHKELSDDT